MLRRQEELVAEAFRQMQLELRRAQSQSVKDSVEIYFGRLREKIADLLTADSQKFDRDDFDQACDPDAPSRQRSEVRHTRVA